MSKVDIAFIIMVTVALPIAGYMLGRESKAASYCKYEYSYDLGKCVREVKDE